MPSVQDILKSRLSPLGRTSQLLLHPILLPKDSVVFLHARLDRQIFVLSQMNYSNAGGLFRGFLKACYVIAMVFYIFIGNCNYPCRHLFKCLWG